MRKSSRKFSFLSHTSNNQISICESKIKVLNRGDQAKMQKKKITVQNFFPLHTVHIGRF